MKNLIFILLFVIVLIACDNKKEVSSIHPEKWEKRTVNNKLSDFLVSGTSYLSVYSQINSISEHRTHDLTATISIRNTNRRDTLFILKAEYFNTKGDLIRSYFNKPVFIRPLETVEIIIDEIDKEGGTGANFLFEWKIKQTSNEPLFEGIMISTSGQQGLSFTTRGVKIN